MELDALMTRLNSVAIELVPFPLPDQWLDLRSELIKR
jgi:hypothetical protein